MVFDGPRNFCVLVTHPREIRGGCGRRLSDAEERKVRGLVLRHGVSDSLGTVADELRSRRCAFTVDGLCVSALGRVRGILRSGEAEDVGPLLQLLLVLMLIVSVYAQVSVWRRGRGDLQFG